MTTPDQGSHLRVNVTGDMMVDGIAIHIGYRVSHETLRVLQIENGRQEWKLFNQNEQVEPAMSLSNDVGRALLDALIRHYQGASDMSTVRADYLHERGRVDKMMEMISDVIKSCTQ